MRYKFRTDLKYSDVTPHADFITRRSLMTGLGGLAAAGLAGLPAGAAAGRYSTDEPANSLEDITGYNNYYEFGLEKDDPARNAHRLNTQPWSVKIDGLVDRPGDYALEDILKDMTIEERIYRMRCVEGWSMVIPWNGFQLSDLLARAGVQSSAKYVAFETLFRPSEMPYQESSLLEWPYREGLRLDEAMNPLTLLATGLYGEMLPNQNGAPLRLVVPWKYGYKSIKSIVRISLRDSQPKTTWNMTMPGTYGFYSNVNPNVDVLRNQSTERPIGGGLFAARKQTQMFNGYAEDVAALYDGMDLVANY